MEKQQETLIKKIVTIAAIGILIFAIGIMVGAQTTDEAGSVNDPLITKSYLDMRLDDVEGGESSSYKKVVLSKGTVLVGQPGTEIMLYQGTASAYSTSKGVVNITVGELATNGTTLGKYCLYLTPDAESGIKAESDVTIFVKGSYSTNK